MSKERCLFLLPRTPWAEQVFPPTTVARLQELVELRRNLTSEQLDEHELLEYAFGVDYIITGWGSPRITDAVFGSAPELKAVFHAAGTVRPVVDDAVFARGVTVTSANHVMSKVTAEAGVAMAMMGNWGVRHWIPAMERGEWKTRDTVVPGIQGRQIGIIGYGAVTRAMLSMIRPFATAPILIASAHLAPEEARQQGLVSSSIDVLLRAADIIFLQTGLNPRTRGMIDRRRLGLIKDDALFINLGRGELVDECALEQALSTGRFRAVLDVYTREPLPEASPLRRMTNVIALPHLGAATRYCREEMGLDVLRSLIDVMNGRDPVGRVECDRAARMSPK